MNVIGPLRCRHGVRRSVRCMDCTLGFALLGASPVDLHLLVQWRRLGLETHADLERYKRERVPS